MIVLAQNQRLRTKARAMAAGVKFAFFARSAIGSNGRHHIRLVIALPEWWKPGQAGTSGLGPVQILCRQMPKLKRAVATGYLRDA